MIEKVEQNDKVKKVNSNVTIAVGRDCNWLLPW